LHRQALARLLLVGLLAALAIAMVATNNYLGQREHEIRQKRDSILQFYEKELPRVEERWQSNAEQMKARIEFSRILEEVGETRWPKFNAFLNAQSEFTHFSNLVIMQGTNQIVFRYGPEAYKIQAPALSPASLWHYAEEAQELYRVYRVPIWLGAQGQGTLVLLKTVNTAEMIALSAPETHLHLFFQDRVLVSSDGDNSKLIRPGVEEASTPTGVATIQNDLPWPGDSLQPTLIVHRELHMAYPLAWFLLRPIAAVLIITILIWVGLGRWLTRTVKRVESLEAATNDYAQGKSSSGISKQFQTAIDQPDEISALGRAMDKLMKEVDGRHLEQKAYLDTLSMLDEAVLEIGYNGAIQRASPGWNKLSHSVDAVGKELGDFIHRDDRELMLTQCAVLFLGEKSYTTFRLRLDTNSSTHFPWVECRLVSFSDESGKIMGIRGVLRDITQTYLHEKQITHMALHDSLTGLPNRVLLEDRVKVAMSQAARTLQKVGVCFIDLDHFKTVNDTLGHSAGDKLLLAFSERLRRQLREGDTVARWGGDEFVVLLPDMDSVQDIRDILQKISIEVQAPLVIEDAEIVVTFSMGVALYPDDAENTETLFSQADRAMFYAKAQGRNQACLYCDMAAQTIDKNTLYIQNRLATAISAQQIQAWFQPIIAAQSGRCTGVEVLARWYDDEYGWISPATFIPIAENIGLIRELGQQILLSSLAAAKRWHNAGQLLTVAINVSKRQLFKPYFTEQLVEEVAKHKIAPHLVILEITESIAMMDVEHAADRLHEIRQAGFKVALDDFGTGYSSLSQLHEMHVDELKIDISFVRRLHERNGLSMTHAIINLARSLEMETVAEGVETEEAANKLRELGADYLQGFYFAKPMPLEEFEKWLNIHNNQ